MKTLKHLAIAAAAAICFAVTSPAANAQVSVQIGAAPDCPYGYYEAPPYACAPYGYYSPEWFANDVFIGVGPWFHGPEHFRGHVDNHFHPEHGYRGPMPERGERPDRDTHHIANFHGNEVRDGRGHVGH